MNKKFWNHEKRHALKKWSTLLIMTLCIVMGLPMALSADAEIARKDDGVVSFPVYQSTTIYKGAVVQINSSGYLVAATDTSGNLTAGVAMEKVDNSSGSDGDLWCKVYTRGVFKLPGTGFSQATVGLPVYALADNSVVVAGSVTNDVLAGVCVGYVDSTHIWVDIGARVS